MSEYTNRLQEMMLSAGRDAPRRVRPSAPYQRFLTFCEYATYAVFLAGWALCIVCHI